MEEIYGKKPGTILYVYDDYTYKDSRNSNILRYNTRRSSKCPGTLKIEKDGKIHLVQDHTHISIKWKIRHSIMKQEMLQLCRDTCLPLKEIFDTVCRKQVFFKFLHIFQNIIYVCVCVCVCMCARARAEYEIR